MTYVKDQTSKELREHIEMLQGMDSWSDPLVTRFIKEIHMLDEKLKKAEAERDGAEAELEQIRINGDC